MEDAANPTSASLRAIARDGAPVPAPVVVPRPHRKRWRPWRKLRRHWSAERLRDELYTLMVVAPLTVLVWVWAERELVDEETFAGVRLELLADATTHVVRPTAANGAPPVVSVRLSGPNASLEEFAALLRDPARSTRALRLADDVPLDAPTNVELRPLLDRDADVRRLGLTVAAVEPSVVTVRVDEIVEVEVAPLLPDAFKTASFTSDPAQVRVRGPGPIGRLREARVTLDVSGRSELASAEPGATVTLRDVTLVASNLPPGASLQPAALASATVTLAETREEAYTIPSVLLFVAAPGATVTGVRYDGPQRITNVRVVGPADGVAQLKDGRATAQAVLYVEREDFDRGPLTRRPEVRGLPPNVRLDGAGPEVQFSVGENAPE